MANKNFNTWLSQFRETIATWGYYTDFEKIYNNVDSCKIELNILNSLIGSNNIENDFRNLIVQYPKVLKAIPILLAKREKEILILENKVLLKFNFSKMNYSIDDYVRFMRENGLFDLMSNHIISNLVDYVTGVEAGLDSNARKNRTGDLMEDLVEFYLVERGLVKDVTYWKEMYKSDVENKFGIDLSVMSNNKNETEKRFDFVVKVSDTVYGIECNFYNGQGSKLNETARSYKAIATETNNLHNFKFVWITDGINGWKKTMKNLKETFEVLDDIYNLKEIEDGILHKIIK